MNLSAVKQARELKAKLDKAQKELSNTLIEVDSGKGAVKVTVDGQQKVLSIKIESRAMDPDKPEQLEKLLLKALNEAMNKSQKVAAKQLKGITGGLKIPGIT